MSYKITYEISATPQSEFMYDIHNHKTGKRVAQVASCFYDEVRDYLVRMMIIPKDTDLVLLNYIGVDRGR